MPTIREVISDALTEINVLQEGETASDPQAVLGLNKLNRLLDNWNADRLAVYADQYLQFTLVPGTSPHTIGPTGATWTTSQRPVSIEGASLIFPGDTNVYVSLNLRDAEWWHEQQTPELETDIPTDLYYNPTWPNGSLFFWPVPGAAYSVELQCRIILANVTLQTTFTMPPGYQDAVTLTLAESLCIPFAKPVPEQLRMEATKARARIFSNNDVTPRLATQDVGMPRQPKPSFNYLTGSNQA